VNPLFLETAQKAFEAYEHDAAFFPVSTMLKDEVLSLPMHTELTEEQLGYITKTILAFFK